MELYESACSSVGIGTLINLYCQVVLTSPGYARDVSLVRFSIDTRELTTFLCQHIPRTAQPQPQALSLQPTPPSLPPLAMSQRGSSDTQIQAIPNDHRRIPHRSEPSIPDNGYSRSDTGVGGPSYENILLHNTSGDRTRPATATPTLTHPERQSEATETHPPSAFSASSAQAAKSQSRKHLLGRQTPPRPKVYIARRPPTSGTLLPENRYCHEDEIVKPFRSHHCRHCGTVSRFFFLFLEFDAHRALLSVF